MLSALFWPSKVTSVRSSNAAHPEDGVARWVTGPTAFEWTRRHGSVSATSRSNDFAHGRAYRHSRYQPRRCGQLAGHAVTAATKRRKRMTMEQQEGVGAGANTSAGASAYKRGKT